MPARVVADLFEGVVGKLEWILLAMAGLGVALVAGILIARSRRRKATAPAATSAPQSTDSPEA